MTGNIVTDFFLYRLTAEAGGGCTHAVWQILTPALLSR